MVVGFLYFLKRGEALRILENTLESRTRLTTEPCMQLHFNRNCELLLFEQVF